MTLDSPADHAHEADGDFWARVRRLGAPALVSLVLLIATLVLWVMSYTSENIPHLERGRFVAIAYHGGLTLRLLSEQPIFGDPPSMQGWMFFGFGAYRMTYVGGYHTSVALPLWFLAILFAVMPATAMRRVARERRVEKRRAENRCVTCGYDLRGSSGPCPECGNAAPRASTDASEA